MKKKHFFYAFALIFIVALESMAAPAKPVKHLLSQPDGTRLEVYLCGDEFLHYYVTTDNILLHKADNGYWKYAVLSADSSIVAGAYIAKMPESRTDEERSYIKGIDKNSLTVAMRHSSVISMAANQQRVAPGEIKGKFPTIGTVRGLVILAEYQDIKFSKNATRELYTNLIAKDNYVGEVASGSVRDYFVSQSNGLFTPEFDVVGPVTLPKERAYYGSNYRDGEKVSDMVIDACHLADENFDIDFTRYDCNDDGTVDFVYVVYAGYGEAQGGPKESVWPQSSTLEYAYWQTIDGMYLGRYSCSCELNDNKGEKLDGIGTFCHEFSHILGLPDVYDPIYSGCPGLGGWDVMDIGGYNNDSKTPAGYTAMDKYTVGWLVPDVLNEAQGNLTLESFSSSNKAYFMVSDKNPNEYYTLENRQNEGWDRYLPGHGLLICHIDYNLHLWNSNRVNTASSRYEHIMLIPADGKMESGDAGDTFPGESNKTSFTDTSEPVANWHSGEKVGMPITNIREDNGIISFDFRSGSGIESSSDSCMKIYGDNTGIICSNPDGAEIFIYTIDGRLLSRVNDNSSRINVPEGIYVVKVGDKVMKVKVG